MKQPSSPGILLGYTVPEGKPVNIPIAHMAVTGQTQQSGKTTTMEALITRSGLKALAFITKRGERGIESGRRIDPYFQERSDWEYVSGLLETLRKERMKFERAWIVRACQGARSLADVRENARRLESSSSGMSKDMYMLLGEYLDKIIPSLALLPQADSVDLEPGLNVMDLQVYPEELQMLVIASTIDWIYSHEADIITIIPECWKYVPQSRNTPVKVVAEKLIREGAGLSNFLWLDSQDMAGVDNVMLRAATVWLIGVQREANEVERALKNIPSGVKKPTASKLARLKIGEFYACWGERIEPVYVRPVWMTDEEALAVATGRAERSGRPEAAPALAIGPSDHPGVNEVIKGVAKMRAELDAQLRQLGGQVVELNTRLKAVESRAPAPASAVADLTRSLGQVTEMVTSLGQSLSKRVDDLGAELAALAGGNGDAGAKLEVTDSRPHLELKVRRPVMHCDTSSLRGRVGKLIAEGYWAKARNGSEVTRALAIRGWGHDKRSVYAALDALTELGFFLKVASGKNKLYTLTSDARVTVKEV